VRVGDPNYRLCSGKRARARVHALRKGWLAQRRVHLPVQSASACGIPASRPLFVLDHDRAYICSDACTVYRAPLDDYDIRISFPWLSLLRRVFVFSQKVNYLVVGRTLYTFSMAHRPDRVAIQDNGWRAVGDFCFDTDGSVHGFVRDRAGEFHAFSFPGGPIRAPPHTTSMRAATSLGVSSLQILPTNATTDPSTASSCTGENTSPLTLQVRPTL